MILVRHFFNVSNIYYYISLWLRNVIFNVVYLAISVAFYLLADFGFEMRIDQATLMINHLDIDTNLNSSKAFYS